MDAGKILFGIAIGIGAVAAVPFTGGGSVFGAVTLASSLAGATTTAVGAGIVGAATGAVLGERVENEREIERQIAKITGFEDGLKEAEIEILNKLMPILDDINERDNYLIGLTAFCYAVAWSDNKIQDEEKNELDYFLNFISDNGTLSPAVIQKLEDIKNTKLNFQSCKHYLNKIKVENLIKFDNVLENIILADNSVNEGESKIKEEWESYYNARKTCFTS